MKSAAATSVETAAAHPHGSVRRSGKARRAAAKAAARASADADADGSASFAPPGPGPGQPATTGATIPPGSGAGAGADAQADPRADVWVEPSTNGAAVRPATTAPRPQDSPKVRSRYRHVEAVHSASQPSCLSHDATENPSFLGFRNLVVIVLAVGNLRLVIENIQKYGVLVCVRCHDFRRSDVQLGAYLYFLIPCHLLIAYMIELVAAKEARSSRLRASRPGAPTSPTEDEFARFQSTWKTIWCAHAANVTFALAFTTYMVYYKIHHPLIGTLTEMHAVIVWLKTASYAFTNRDLRHAYLHPVKGELDALPELYLQRPYPMNITIGNLIYFWGAPTLVYQPVYPRTERVRWLFVAKRLGEVVCLGVFIWFMSAQYAAPVLRNSLDKVASLDLPAILERLLKLSTISLVIWLAGFFALFQSFLNALAEVTRFGDRSFYDAWWNSESLGTYWRTWNKPVYQFFKRHVYSPMRSRGWSHKAASFTVFVVSAILHELLVGVPTHNLIGVAFLGMFFQLPLIQMTAPLEKMKSAHGKLLGNTIFWVSFTILGQPFAALMYFYAWQAKYGSVSRSMPASEAHGHCPPLAPVPPIGGAMA